MRLIYAYKSASKSANALADAMDIPLCGRDINLTKGGPQHTVINWGSGNLTEATRACRVINKPDAVCKAVNKLESFKALTAANVSTVPWTTNNTVAHMWLQGNFRVCVRSTIEGKDGEGLSIISGVKTDWFGKPLALPKAALYTKFIPSKAEYRVNVCGGRTMGVQKKVPAGTITDTDIKTGGNGYGFHLLNENEIPKGIRPVARDAIAALGLDFGGVDILVGMDGVSYVLECNTAPELTPSMVTAFAAKLKDM